MLSDRIIVMNRGKVEQISRPVDVYTRPKTSFVAQFIGRNTVIPGTLRTRTGDIAVIETAYGRLSGTLNAPTLSASDPVDLVIPSEALDVILADGDDRLALSRRYSGNLIEGEVQTREVVGHSVYFGIALDDGRALSIESHVGKYRGKLASAKRVLVGWEASAATVIPHG